MAERREPRGLSEASRAAMTRRLGATVLTFEALVVFFAALAASRISDDVSSGVALAVGGGLALACLLTAGTLRSRRGFALGWAVQVLVLATALVVPVMVVLGLLFGALWVAALRIGAMVATPPPAD